MMWYCTTPQAVAPKMTVKMNQLNQKSWMLTFIKVAEVKTLFRFFFSSLRHCTPMNVGLCVVHCRCTVCSMSVWVNLESFWGSDFLYIMIRGIGVSGMVLEMGMGRWVLGGMVWGWGQRNDVYLHCEIYTLSVCIHAVCVNMFMQRTNKGNKNVIKIWSSPENKYGRGRKKQQDEF